MYLCVCDCDKHANVTTYVHPTTLPHHPSPEKSVCDFIKYQINIRNCYTERVRLVSRVRRYDSYLDTCWMMAASLLFGMCVQFFLSLHTKTFCAKAKHLF